MVFGQKLWKNGTAYGFNGSKAQLAGQLHRICHGVFRLGQIPHDGRGVAVKYLSLVGERRLLADTVKEMDAKFPLQLLDLNGDGGL